MAQKAIKQRTPEEDKTNKEFSPGDLAVYPAYGVVRIESVESREIDGQRQDFYVMNILENNMIIMIPTKNVALVGLRDVINKKQVPEIYKIIKRKDEILNENHTWNRRQREYMDKIKTGSLHEVAEVFRDLFRLKLKKSLAFGERKLYDTVEGLLIKELSVVKNKEKDVVMSEIKSLFRTSKRRSGASAGARN